MWKRTATEIISSLPRRRTLTTSWRKEQLNQLLRKRKTVEPAQTIQNEEDLQPMWQAMERRVKNRPPPSPKGNGKSGRTNIKKTEEDVWLEQGLYDHHHSLKKEDDANGPKPK